ncbi:importin-13-like [Oppia nitens]|uniref:importin-13-like n=1 Tax=Oppia nitens TaxID=1686743 RepID=UPI0023DC535B|nr:importin-13-like [Oppia nitens]
MDLTVETIERLIHELYNNSNQMTQSEANQYLTCVQMSSQAWDVVAALLNPNKPLEVQYFGASTLYTKITKFYHELDPQKQLDLKNQLMQLLLSYLSLDGMRIVETRIVVCLAAYVVHSVANNWENAVTDLVNHLQPNKLSHISINRVLQALMDLLSAIPEEFQTIYLTQQQKTVIRSALLKFNEQIFSIILSLLSEPQLPEEIHLATIKCFSNWAQNTGPLIIGDKHEEIVLLVLRSVCDDFLSQTAVETITNIYSHPEMHKQPTLVLKLIDQMVGLEPTLNKAIQESNQDMANNIYTLFIQILETHSRLLLDALIDKPQYLNNILKAIAIVLQCSSTPGYHSIDENCSEQAFNFWYTLQDDIIASDESRIETYLVMFNQLFHSLIDAFIIKVQYPTDEVYENEWNSYDRESFRCYRQDIGDSFMYCYNILRVSMLSSLLTHFQMAINRLTTQLNTDPQKSWQYLEAVLYTFSSIAESVNPSETVYLNQLFTQLPNIPFAYVHSPRLLATAMDTMASHAEWISANSAFLPNVLSLLMIGLKADEYVTISATMALKDITRECQLIIKPYAQQILSICEQSLSSESHLKPKEKSRIMCSIGLTLSVLPIEEIMVAINKLLTPIITDIHNVLNECEKDTNNISNEVVRTHVSAQLSMLAMLFSTLDVNLKRNTDEDYPIETIKKQESSGPQPIYIILEQVLPIFNCIGTKWPTDEPITESLCECIKKSVITLLDDIKPLVGKILQLLHFLYKSSAQTSILEISKQLIILFAFEKDLQNDLTKYFVELCNHTIICCQQDLRQQTALLEVFYSCLANIVKKVPVLYSSNLLDVSSLFRCAMSALILPEKPTVRYSSSFISEFIIISREVEAMNKVVNEEIENLIGQIFAVIGGTFDSPRNVVEHMADILMALNWKYFDNLTRCMNTLIQREGFPTVHANADKKTHFVRLILTQRKNKRKLKEIINEFSLTCRGLIGNEYSNQMIKLPF